MEFKAGDKVKVIAKNSRQEGKLGTVETVHSDKQTLMVQMEQGNLSGFFVSELELVDLKREALIELAETLDRARQQANAISIPVIESQRGVYGQIELALHDVVEQIVGEDIIEVATVYTSIVAGGNTVREALAQWRKAMDQWEGQK
jgi:hypothetical protein